MKLSLKLLAALFSAAFCLQASAATVTNNSDSGAGSLRQAIIDSASGGTIDFAPSLNGQTITLTSGELLVDKSVTISGPRADKLAVSGNNASRVFHIGAGQTVTIAGLTITNGAEPPFVILEGGGIYNDHSALTVSNCTLSGNSASYGGGIKNDGSGGSATLEIMNCTLSGNSTSGTGGAIFNDGQSGGSATLEIVNSTLSGNSASANSGAILNYGVFGGSAILKIVNSTFSNNAAGNDGSISNIGSQGSATVEIGNSILNTTSLTNDTGTITSAGYNLSSDNGGGFLTATGDQTNTRSSAHSPRTAAQPKPTRPYRVVRPSTKEKTSRPRGPTSAAPASLAHLMIRPWRMRPVATAPTSEPTNTRTPMATASKISATTARQRPTRRKLLFAPAATATTRST